MEQNVPARQLRTNRGMIKTVLLNIITLGIYAFWLEIKMKQWLVKHTHIA